MGILELNEDGGGNGGKGGVDTIRFLFGEPGRDSDVGVGVKSEDVDGVVDTGEEDSMKWDLVGELVVELDCLVVVVVVIEVEPWPLLLDDFRLGSGGAVITRLPLNSRRRLLLRPFNIEVEDPLDEFEESRVVAPATKAALPWARLHFSAILQAASTARSTMG